MQLMIDIAQETPEALDLAAVFLQSHAALKRAGGLPAYTGGEPFGSNADVPAGTPDAPVPPVPVVIPPAPPAAPNNVVPFPTPVPPAPTAAAPATSTPNPTSAPVPVPPPAPPAPNVAASAAVNTSQAGAGMAPAGAADEYDSSGFPFDARIHQKGKGKKKDLTWKLQKGIDAALVTAVTQELAAAGRMRAPGSASAPAVEVPAAPSFPAPGAVPLPPPPAVVSGAAADTAGTVGAVPVPPPPAVGGVPVPPPPVLVPPAPSAAVPVPPAPTLGVPDAAQQGVVQVTDFRSLVAKITAARNAGKITAEQVTAYIQQAGAPSLQLLNSMPHLVSVVNDLLDAHFAMS